MPSQTLVKNKKVQLYTLNHISTLPLYGTQYKSKHHRSNRVNMSFT